jgi:hypothetical protein
VKSLSDIAKGFNQIQIIYYTDHRYLAPFPLLALSEILDPSEPAWGEIS